MKDAGISAEEYAEFLKDQWEDWEDLAEVFLRRTEQVTAIAGQESEADRLKESYVMILKKK